METPHLLPKKSFEDSEPKDVFTKVFPRFMAISERLWGGGNRAGAWPAWPISELWIQGKCGEFEKDYTSW